LFEALKQVAQLYVCTLQRNLEPTMISLRPGFSGRKPKGGETLGDFPEVGPPLLVQVEVRIRVRLQRQTKVAA
jgi:hypothetical protein